MYSNRGVHSCNAILVTEVFCYRSGGAGWCSTTAAASHSHRWGGPMAVGLCANTEISSLQTTAAKADRLLNYSQT